MSLLDNEPPRRQNASAAAALELYDRYGLNPLAAATKTKIPLGEWRRWQTERIDRRTVEVAFSHERRNIWVPCGGEAPGCLLALDCDSEEATEYWRERLGDVLEETACQKTGRGHQFLFTAPAGKRIPGVDGRKQPGELDWEIKGDGQGVILPPSVHPSGSVYTWVRGMEHRADAPAELLEAAKEAKKGAEESVPADRSKLAELLASPAVAGGRNNWLAQVAGHLAKWVPFRDAYERLVDVAAEQCRPPVSDDDADAPGELSKLKRSIWDTEQERRANLPAAVEAEVPANWQSEEPWKQAVSTPSWETGFLSSGGNCIEVQCYTKEGGVYTDPWMDADAKVLGVIARETSRAYLLELRRGRDGSTKQAVMPAEVLASPKDLAAWLGAYGVGIKPPPNVAPRLDSRGDRLRSYLEEQRAPEAKVIPHIGVYREPGSMEGDFITHEEVIRDAGSMPFEAVRPDPALIDWAPYRYGQTEESEARAVLSKVLEFHDETVTAVFGSWWAAVFLKPWIQDWVSQFPIMGLEAPSESGKTTGFFEIMHRLSGWSGSQVNPTRAALRDYLSAHNAGYVWVDDLDALGDREELLRQVTVGGSLVKKSGDHHGQTSALMRAALAISGESLGLSGQKALIDRVALLEVPNPKGRQSKDGTRSQWEEIIEFRNANPDLTQYAGTIVRMALQQVDRVAEVSDLRVGPGRHGDKVAVLRIGARVLTHLRGEDGGELVDRVDDWCEHMTDLGAENSLTLRILPWALAQTEWRSRPTGPDDHHGKVATPALVDDEETVWFSPRLLAHWWSNHQRGRISQRTDTEEALTQQARALGLGGTHGDARKDFLFIGGTGKARYWRCDPGLSELILERSRG